MCLDSLPDRPSFYILILQVPWSQISLALSVFLLILTGQCTMADPDIGGGGSFGGELSTLEADDPDFSGMVDFSNAIPGPDGSWCITKTKYVEHMVKDQVKECWHQNVTQCHDTYVTEFLPSQEQKCEESFWKSCKIDFKEAPYNYSMKQCHTPLKKQCDPPIYNANANDADIVCKTWFESECNTTFVNTSPNKDDLPNTWCKKVPRKICAPDNCKMVPGKEVCNEKMMVSTIQQPSEVCDLQPQTHCRLVTRLVPHLIQKEVCRAVPKEMCHLTLANPHLVKKPMRLRWCTKTPPEGHAALNLPVPSYKPSYLPPPPRPGPQRPGSAKKFQPPNNDFATFSSPTTRPALQFQRRSHNVFETTKFKPILAVEPEEEDLLIPEPQQQEGAPSNVLIQDFFVQNSKEDMEMQVVAEPLTMAKKESMSAEIDVEEEEQEQAPSPQVHYYQHHRESFKLPRLSRRPSMQSAPVALVSISDDLSGVDSYPDGVFSSVYHNHGESGLRRRK
jgi:hypothetical protein